MVRALPETSSTGCPASTELAIAWEFSTQVCNDPAFDQDLSDTLLELGNLGTNEVVEDPASVADNGRYGGLGYSDFVHREGGSNHVVSTLDGHFTSSASDPPPLLTQDASRLRPNASESSVKKPREFNEASLVPYASPSA